MSEVTGAIFGKIVDAAGAPIAGVRVSLLLNQQRGLAIQ
jgi:hypothetical protein